MLRQISNLVHTGRIRTGVSTARRRKPAALRDNPTLEIVNLLEMVLAHQGTPNQDFFFVQIGAFDGCEGDHLYDLLQAHRWAGVLVEPQPQAFKRLKQTYADRDNLKFFNVAIGPQDGSITLYTRTTGSVPIASVSRHLLIKPGHPRSQVVGINVPCWTFDRLMVEAGMPPRVDLLQIDTEGFDFQIIRSIRFDRLKPRIIRFEHTLLSERDRNDCVTFLAGHGYRFLLEDRDTMAVLTPEAAAQAA